jgi:hypothetical protein
MDPKSESNSTEAVPSRAKRVLRMAGITIVNLALVAVIIGLVVATGLPAYIYHHPDIKIGESYSK